MSSRSFASACSILLRSTGPVVDLDSVLAVCGAFDIAARYAVGRYSEARKRMYEAFDRIGSASIETDDVDGFLQRLLGIFQSTARVADCASIFLREGDTLRVRASVGLEEEMQRGYSFPIGVGFAGRVAAERRPILLHGASEDPMVASDVLRAKGVLALYGVPLLHGDELLGVAHIGSTTEEDFPDLEMRLVTAAAQRASMTLARQMYREAAATRTAELEAIIRSIPDAVYIGTAEGITMENARALEQLGYDRPEQLDRELSGVSRGIDVRDAKTGDVVPFDEQPFARALQGETTARDVVVRNVKSRQEVFLRSTAAPVQMNGRIIGAVAVNTDVTRVRDMERERVDFMNAVVHDLRNPLQAVRMLARSIARHFETHDERPMAERARRLDEHAERMNRLLGDLLDLSLATIGQLGVALEPLDYRRLVEEVAADWRAEVAERPIAVLLPATPVTVRGDEDWLRQVLGNLLSNAVKYSPHEARIEVAVHASDGLVETAVHDEGPGIPPAERERVFLPYFRGGGKTVKGHGLGLFVTRAIVLAHEGDIGVESEPGRGTTFRFRLPVATKPQ